MRSVWVTPVIAVSAQTDPLYILGVSTPLQAMRYVVPDELVKLQYCHFELAMPVTVVATAAPCEVTS